MTADERSSRTTRIGAGGAFRESSSAMAITRARLENSCPHRLASTRWSATMRADSGLMPACVRARTARSVACAIEICITNPLKGQRSFALYAQLLHQWSPFPALGGEKLAQLLGRASGYAAAAIEQRLTEFHVVQYGVHVAVERRHER